MKKITMLLMSAILAIPVFASLPEVQLKDINGNSVNTAQLNNDGKPMVISFWATWCKPCRRELKAIHEQYPDWQDETGVKVIAVSIDEAQNEQKVKPVVDTTFPDFDILLDPNGEFKRQMGVTDIPHAFIIDGNGNIVWSHQGYVDGGESEILEKLQELVK